MKQLKKLVRLNVRWTEESWTPKICFAPFGVPVPRLAPLPVGRVSHRCYGNTGHNSLFSSRGTRGFTLIELLVVIGIIAILASIAFPVIARVKTNAKKQLARAEMANLITAINAYESEYSRPPAAKMVEDMLSGLTDRDYTYGGAAVPNGRGLNVNYTNDVVMKIIMDIDADPNKNHARNPRRHVVFNAKRSSGSGAAGLDGDGILRDPWGNPYVITIDMNDDNKCDDAFYSDPHQPQDWIPAPVAIWSAGPDGDYNTKGDNVVSWK